MKYPQQDALDVFVNNAGTISITSKDYWCEEQCIMVNPHATRFLIKSLTELLQEIDEFPPSKDEEEA